jgi:hypothetical protein
MGMTGGTVEVLQDDTGMSRITLDLACYGCHGDGAGGGGNDVPLALEALASLAAGIHQPDIGN